MLNTIINFFMDKAVPLFIGFTGIGLLKFTIFNGIYVILNTIKTTSSVKAGANDAKAKRTSSILSTITYAYYTIILKMVAQNNILESFFGTGISNYFGNYIGIGLSKKVIKRNWKFCTVNMSREKYSDEEIKSFINDITSEGIKYNASETFQFKPGTLDKEKFYYNITVFSKTEQHDKMAEKLMAKHNIIRKTGWSEGGPIEEELLNKETA